VKRIFFSFLLLGFLSAAYGQTKEQDITKLLEVSNTRQEMLHTIEVMIAQFEQMLPEVPQAFWNLFWEKLDVESLLVMIVPIYDEYFTHEDIKNLILFYESPVGKKLVKVTPSITERAMVAGQVWGQKLGEDIIEELTNGGYIK
jgi:hypothetical protein